MKKKMLHSHWYMFSQRLKPADAQTFLYQVDEQVLQPEPGLEDQHQWQVLS
jgi:hypothetical protein